MESDLSGIPDSNVSSNSTIREMVSTWVIILLLVVISIITLLGFYYYRQLQHCKYYPDGWCFTDWKCSDNYSPYHETEALKERILELRSGNNPESVAPADWLRNGRSNRKDRSG